MGPALPASVRRTSLREITEAFMSGISALVGLKLGYGARAWLRKAVFVASLVFFVRPAIAETVILAFGDSLTAGFGLAEEDGFARQLEGWLRDRARM